MLVCHVYIITYNLILLSTPNPVYADQRYIYPVCVYVCGMEGGGGQSSYIIGGGKRARLITSSVGSEQHENNQTRDRRSGAQKEYAYSVLYAEPL